MNQTNQSNPYDFLTSTPAKPKKSLLPSGNSKTGRMVLVVAGGVALILIAIIVISLLGSGGEAVKADYAKLVRQQNELVRVSQLGDSKARQSATKNLAVTAELTVASQQQELLAIAKKAGAPTDKKSLSSGQDPKTDEALTTAEQTNQFDEEFTKILIVQLQAYQAQLKKLYDASGNPTNKEKLSKSYIAINDLLANLGANEAAS